MNQQRNISGAFVTAPIIQGPTSRKVHFNTCKMMMPLPSGCAYQGNFMMSDKAVINPGKPFREQIVEMNQEPKITRPLIRMPNFLKKALKKEMISTAAITSSGE